MKRKRSPRSLVFSALFLCFCSGLFAQFPAGPNRPASVPAGYVITPSGYFHSSCLHMLAKGDTLQQNGSVVQHADGSLTSVPVCNYPRYNKTGAKIETESNTGEETNPGNPEDSGWIVDARTTTSAPYGELIATWTVPPQPTSNDGQTIYMFPGMDNPSVGSAMLIQ